MPGKEESYKEKEFSHQVGEKEKRKLKAAREIKRSPWFGLGVAGMIGWTVAVPTLLGTGLGIWLDKKYPQTFSWTLTLLVTGLVLGCLLAWQWVEKEKNALNNKDKDGE